MASKHQTKCQSFDWSKLWASLQALAQDSPALLTVIEQIVADAQAFLNTPPDGLKKGGCPNNHHCKCCREAICLQVQALLKMSCCCDCCDDQCNP